MRAAVTILLCSFLATGCVPESGVTDGGGNLGGGGGGGTPLPPGPDAAQVQATFVGNMTQANWDAANMQLLASADVKWGTKCADCHLGGAGALLADYDSTIMFTRNRDEFFNGFFQVSGSQVVPAFAKLDNAGQRAGHRTYSLSQDARDALTNFVTLTNGGVVGGGNGNGGGLGNGNGGGNGGL